MVSHVGGASLLPGNPGGLDVDISRSKASPFQYVRLPFRVWLPRQFLPYAFVGSNSKAPRIPHTLAAYLSGVLPKMAAMTGPPKPPPPSSSLRAPVKTLR